MNNEPTQKAPNDETNFAVRVGAIAARKLKARRASKDTVWLGFGMMGLIGWSVVVPTLIGGRGGSLAGQSPSGQACLDAGAARGGARDRLL